MHPSRSINRPPESMIASRNRPSALSLAEVSKRSAFHLMIGCAQHTTRGTCNADWPYLRDFEPSRTRAVIWYPRSDAPSMGLRCMCRFISPALSSERACVGWRRRRCRTNCRLRLRPPTAATDGRGALQREALAAGAISVCMLIGGNGNIKKKQGIGCLRAVWIAGSAGSFLAPRSTSQGYRRASTRREQVEDRPCG